MMNQKSNKANSPSGNNNSNTVNSKFINNPTSLLDESIDSYDGSDDPIFAQIKVVSILAKNNESILYKIYILPEKETFYVCKKILLERIPVTQRNRANNLENNLKVIQKLIHPHIVKHYKIFSNQNSLSFVMDYYPLGSVEDRLKKDEKPLPQNMFKAWFSQILGAVHYIHCKGMAHRNLKLTSILIISNEMVILSGFVNNCLAYKRDLEIMRSTSIGDITYQAPEMHSVCSRIWPYNAKASDVYALGVCLFRMVNFDPPFDPSLFASNSLQYIFKQRNKEYHYNSNFVSMVSQKIRHLISQMLEPAPGLRITANSALLHEALYPE